MEPVNQWLMTFCFACYMEKYSINDSITRIKLKHYPEKKLPHLPSETFDTFLKSKNKGKANMRDDKMTMSPKKNEWRCPPQKSNFTFHSNEYLCLLSLRQRNGLFLGLECLARILMNAYWAEWQRNNGKITPRSHSGVEDEFIWTHLFPWRAIKCCSSGTRGRDGE